MNRDSIRLAWAGTAIGVLVLSAVVFADARPPARREERGTGTEPAAATAPADFGGEAVAALAQESGGAETFAVRLRAEDPIPGERLFLCDAAGCPLEELEPDADGGAALGPLAPGSYGIWRGATEIGCFRLLADGALGETAGRLWTDGRFLHLGGG